MLKSANVKDLIMGKIDDKFDNSSDSLKNIEHLSWILFDLIKQISGLRELTSNILNLDEQELTYQVLNCSLLATRTIEKSTRVASLLSGIIRELEGKLLNNYLVSKQAVDSLNNALIELKSCELGGSKDPETENNRLSHSIICKSSSVIETADRITETLILLTLIDEEIPDI